MRTSEVYVELYGRIPPLVRDAVQGLNAHDLRWAPRDGANPVGWLVWHLTRVQDHHVSELLDEPQLWVADGWAARFRMAPDPQNIGYGHDAGDVAVVEAPGPEVLVDYHDAVHARTIGYLRSLTDDDLDRIVDRRWDPPVTLGVRLVSIADDSLQHVGQAAYLRGLLQP